MHGWSLPVALHHACPHSNLLTGRQCIGRFQWRSKKDSQLSKCDWSVRRGWGGGGADLLKWAEVLVLSFPLPPSFPCPLLFFTAGVVSGDRTPRLWPWRWVRPHVTSHCSSTVSLRETHVVKHTCFVCLSIIRDAPPNSAIAKCLSVWPFSMILNQLNSTVEF